MALSRSTFYDFPASEASDQVIVDAIRAICDAFESYGYRCVGAALRHEGLVVNGKKIHRLMREHELQPRRRRRYVAPKLNKGERSVSGRCQALRATAAFESSKDANHGRNGRISLKKCRLVPARGCGLKQPARCREAP